MRPQRYWGHDFDLLGSRDVIDHVTIGLGVGTFLLMVNDDHAPILHGYEHSRLQRFWGHESDLLGSRWGQGRNPNIFGATCLRNGARYMHGFNEPLH